MKSITLVIDIEDVGDLEEMPDEIRATYEAFDSAAEERRQDVADCVTSAIGATGGVFSHNGDADDLFKWLCANGYVSVSPMEDGDV